MKASLPKGTRDFGTVESVRRSYIFDTIRTVFNKYGYAPIETPALENLSTLTGKYGEEGDKLLFKVLNNGDFLSKADEAALEARDSNALVSSISKRGLRYDLTVPFARFVVMNQHQIQLPFKRSQIQPVWRADRPQKGRYQEFYQCDADVVGSDSLMYEAELVNIYQEVFERLNIHVDILVNNRKVLMGIAEVCGISDRFVEMTTVIDKLDKVGVQGVRKELTERDFGGDVIESLLEMLNLSNLSELENALTDSPTGRKGVEELRTFHQYLDTRPVSNVRFDVRLARGLGYYTGCIFEVVLNETKHPEVQMGSLGGGGRYDNLTGIFGLDNVSGVGISFGAERIYDVLEELKAFPADLSDRPSILFIAFDESSHIYAYGCAQDLRKTGIAADVYPEPGKMKKQFKYADARGIPYVGIVGETEVKENKVMFKDLSSGEQKALSTAEIIDVLKA